MKNTMKFGSAIAAIAAMAVLGVARPGAAALSTCNGNLQIGYTTGPNFPNVGDTERVQLSIGTGQIQNGTTMTLNRVRFDLDCTNTTVGQIPCTDDGVVVGYAGDGTITSTCLDHAGGTLVGWSTGHATSGSPNEVVFTPSTALSIAANTPTYCTLEFDVTVLAHSNDATPDIAEESAGFNASQSDASCNNTGGALASSSAQSGSIPLCQICNDNNECTADSCNNDTNECVFTPNVTCDDNNACTADSCNPANGQCVFTSNVNCDDNNACTADSCNPANGQCVHTSNVNCDDNNACTADSCNPANGQCVHTQNVTCNDNNACTADTCNPANGQCVFTSNVQCDDGNACTADSCNPSTGACVHTPNVTCDDNNLCTSDSCNPATGQCVFTPTVTCDDPTCQECKPDTGQCADRNPLPSSCQPVGCRITMGGIILQGGTLETDPTQPAEILKGTFGGQVGAPCGCIGCFDEFDNIQGNCEYSRKTRKGSFLGKDFLSLICGCDDGTSAAPSFDPKGQLCGDRQVGPTPPRAPANIACWTGVGAFNETGGRRTTQVAFRIEVEDRGEPGAGKNDGGTTDVYRIFIWIPGTGENAMDLAEQACCSNTPPNVRAADIADGGPLIHGNIQIHPETPLTDRGICPPPDACMSPLP